jgi:CDP-glucose 4,6-dehydratase
VEEVGLNPEFWRGRRVLITGSTGFKGSWLALWLDALGAAGAGYSLAPPTDPSLFELARIPESIPTTHGDVRDLDALKQAIHDHAPEIVIHMAAQSLVRRSYQNPVETYMTNVAGTVNVLEAVRGASGVRVVINVTTDKVYENREDDRAYREQDRLSGRDPYSSSKAASELVTSAYRESFFAKDSGTALATARAGNVIGGGDWGEDRLVPDLVRAASEGRPARVRHPDAVRPWQHVLNPLSGYLRLVEVLWEQPELAGAWNFGPDERDVRPVRTVADRLCELWDGEMSFEHDPGEHPHEAGLLRLDSTRAREGLGWAPRWDLETALRAIAGWYAGYARGEDARALVLRQIEAFTTGTAP